MTAAKLEVAGEVGTDLPAGPSEGMVLADASADPRFVAADLITQAEHGPDSPALLVTTDAAFADRVLAEVAGRSPTRRARAILERALGEHGRVVLAPTLDAAIDFVNAYAPEHLSVDVEPLEPTVARLRNAGSLFVGPGRRSPPATTRRARTTSCRPAVSRVRRVACRSSRTASTPRSSG